MTLNSVTLRCALETKYNTKPKVDLKNPDITVIAEILGPITAIGISRREWRGVVPTNLNNWPPIFCRQTFQRATAPLLQAFWYRDCSTNLTRELT
jgi:hypothetical protein